MRNTLRMIAVALLGISAGSATAQPAATTQPAAPLKTRWAADVKPAAPWPEFPQPQLNRPNWTNLNGPWQWAPAKPGEEPPFGTELPGRIVVPYPIESSLSGVGQHVERLWCRRTFDLAKTVEKQHCLLNFEAVDWEAVVYVNGKKIGEHRGGYDHFNFDITDALKSAGPQELIVGVFDPTDAGDQPRGKQVCKPEGIWYTPTTGIWQTVWIESVADNSIRDLVIMPDPDSGTVRIQARTTASHALITASVNVGDQEIAKGSAPAGTTLEIKVAEPKLWSPESPFLYDLHVKSKVGDIGVETVDSYFAFRKIEVAKDNHGVSRIFLNGQPYFQVGPLDQGFWPDGLYTAPTDEALRADVEMIKKLGFNMVRKHVKVEPDRWYYWADRLGVLVWQDMPSPMPPGDKWTDAGKRQYETELTRMIESLRNHPSIVTWVVFNEGWGQHDTRRYVELVKKLDPTRLVDNASGWTDEKCGDLMDIHNYPEAKSPAPEPHRAAVLGEFGGLGLPVPGHTWQEKAWGYQKMGDNESLTRKYEKLLQEAYRLRDEAGLSAVVYTQLTDVETECNGLLTYDRAVIKPDLERVAAANRGDFSKVPPPPVINEIVPTSQKQPQTWQYVLQPPDEAWNRPDFAAAQWKAGPGGFGTRGTPGAVVGTEWNTSDIWLRREFTLADTQFAALHFRVHHDEDCEIYVNGTLVAKLNGFTNEYVDVPVESNGLAAMKRGANTLAAHCYQTGGGQFIDVGLVDYLPPAVKPASK